ncbi:MAG: hypothetical protein KKI02_05285, partial [Planctomycetes bacterium]|nr:hypothetical protein [Planctomycetota bacterium]
MQLHAPAPAFHLTDDKRLLTGALISGLFLLLFFTHGLLTLFALFVFGICTVWSCRKSILCFARRVILVFPVAGIYLW